MTGSGTALDPWTIWDVNDLQAVGNGAPYLLTDWYQLGGNIDASATATWNWNAVRGVFEGFVPLCPGRFSGHFNGNYFAISDLYFNRVVAVAYNAGLFALSNGTIENVILYRINYYAETSVGALLVGALVGHTEGGTYRRCCATGQIETLCSGLNTNTGGLIGYHEGNLVELCFADVDVDANTGGAATGYAGGLLGTYWNRWFGGVTVQNCYARGTVSAPNGAGGLVGVANNFIPATAHVNFCYSTGQVVEFSIRHGGLIGDQQTNVIPMNDSFWDIDTSTQVISFGGIGRNTPVMKTEANYTAVLWDFALIWDIDLTGWWNDGYPYFRWFAPATITVVSPNGGETWARGSTHNILWTHTKDPGLNIQIELLLAGVVDEVIVASIPIGPYGGGTYSWTIDAGKAPSKFYTVRISSTTTPCTDDSNKEFTITGAAPPEAKVVTLPATGVR